MKKLRESTGVNFANIKLTRGLLFPIIKYEIIKIKFNFELIIENKRIRKCQYLTKLIRILFYVQTKNEASNQKKVQFFSV